MRIPTLILGTVLLFSAGCTSAPERDQAPTANPEPAPIATVASPIPVLSEARASELMYDLLSSNPDIGSSALAQVLEGEDRRFIPVLLELMRASEVGRVQAVGHASAVAGLEALSGQRFGASWPAWVEWYGGTDLQPPPGFAGWKGELLSFIDPRFADFLRDDLPAKLRVEEIVWGGVTVDGIPALDQPPMIDAQAADYLEPDEPVLGLSLNGDARAYPLRIMDWHEMANDTVGGVPVVLSYCTLCGAAIAYDGRASNGATYDFGSSGFLYRSNKLMYDRQTRTLWNQLTAEPVLGDLADEEISLELLPVVLTTWREWVSQHPETVVLELQTGYERYYFPGAAYGDYFASEATMFPVWQRSALLGDKDRIYALRVEGIAKAYPLDRLFAEQVVNDTIGSTELVLVVRGEPVVVEGTSLQTGRINYDAGGEIRAFMRGANRFRPGPAPDTLVDQSGATWRLTEEALLGPNDQRAARVGGHLAYWFGWYAFFPQTLVYGEQP